MQFKAYFDSFTLKGTDESQWLARLPVNFIMVNGGTKRFIDFKVTDDMSIISEFEQARTFKNLNIYLSSTPNGDDMRAALFLSDNFTKKARLNIGITVVRSEGGNMLEGVKLDAVTKLKEPPSMYFGQLLIKTKLISDIKIIRGHVEQNYMSPEDYLEI